METLTDVLQMILRLSPVREEAVLVKGLAILEDAREKLDGAVAKVEDEAEAEVPTAPATVPTSPVAGL
jgi:hypothetical protein